MIAVEARDPGFGGERKRKGARPAEKIGNRLGFTNGGHDEPHDLAFSFSDGLNESALRQHHIDRAKRQKRRQCLKYDVIANGKPS